MSKSVFCTATASQTDTIVRSLKAAGFSGNDISVLMADKSGTKDFGQSSTIPKAPEGTATAPRDRSSYQRRLGWLAGIGGAGHSRSRPLRCRRVPSWPL